jgi:[acyl-carrier-protein] S-malonyltransferase
MTTAGGAAPRLAIAFPGQGTQRAGMARDFHQSSTAAREVFGAASEALGLDVAALCFEADPRLETTEYAQPAILTAEIAMLRALEKDFGVAASVFGGHSLGEYAGLVAAGVLDLAPAVVLVRERGRLMQAAAPAEPSGMIAVVQPSMNIDALVAGLAESGVDVANINSADQVVLSGRKSDLDTAAVTIRTIEGFARARCLPLKVSGPFHSRWMKPAGDTLRALLEADSSTWRADGATRVTCNVSGGMHDADAASIVDLLARQVSAPVRWLDNMKALAARADRVIELGPGKPLRAFFSSIGVDAVSVTSWEAAAALG